MQCDNGDTSTCRLLFIQPRGRGKASVCDSETVEVSEDITDPLTSIRATVTYSGHTHLLTPKFMRVPVRACVCK